MQIKHLTKVDEMRIIFLTFLRLGCTSFGGPVAHLAYFREEFVVRKQWFSELDFAGIISLCQFIPGPSSSQVGVAIGFARAGYLGAFSAWLGFTMPSALLLYGMAVSLIYIPSNDIPTALQGLQIVAAAIVAHAVWGMQKQLCFNGATRAIALIVCFVLSFTQTPVMQILMIIAGSLAGVILPKNVKPDSQSRIQFSPVFSSSSATQKYQSACLLIAFLLLLGSLPLMANQTLLPVQVFDTMYRAGALVFGGGHVVLPLLHSEVIANGWVTESQLLTGYGAAQAVPGPLFTFSTFIGAIAGGDDSIPIALLATIAIFLPGMLLLFALLPYWSVWSQFVIAQRVLIGINAAVVGLLAATLFSSILPKAIQSVTDAVIAGAALVMLIRFRSHPLWVIFGCVGANLILGWLN